jgi:hypothetical protein
MLREQLALPVKVVFLDALGALEETGEVTHEAFSPALFLEIGQCVVRASSGNAGRDAPRLGVKLI